MRILVKLSNRLIVQKPSVNGLATDPVVFQPYGIRLANPWNLLLFAVKQLASYSYFS